MQRNESRPQRVSLQDVSLHETAKQLGLTAEETDEIIRRLGRAPSLTEISMLSVEWSEHCSYRRSRKFFSKFPRTGPVPVLVGEDAGGILLEDLAIVFKVESHNHPSQIEPKHGAATGVGGIIRDILSVGARPVALLNSLRFGSLSDPANRRLFRGVVDGIQWYGNSIGIPTVGGEIDFHPAYAGNCLVNVMCVGVANKDSLLTSKAKAGNAVMILGARTGRDGIGGCSVLASQEMREALSKRPTVQVGDPYFGKCLIEATLEAAANRLFVAIKDMGAAGLTCTTSEMSAGGGCGMEVDTAKIPAREKGMEAWEFMMSESQERMLAVVDFKHTDDVRKIFHKWGLEAEVIGKTIPDTVVKIYSGTTQLASLSTQVLVEPPPVLPQSRKSVHTGQASTLPRIPDLKKTILEFLAHPSLVSKKWAFQQYDSMVQTNTIVGPGQDAAVIRVPNKSWGIAVVMEGNGRYCKIDPNLGAQYIVAEAARNLIAIGAKPLALSDGLNFGNPDKPESYGEFIAAMDGLASACKELELPVVSGNVSFYNETSETIRELAHELQASELQAFSKKTRHNENDKGRILPTPIIGMVGQIPDIQKITPMAFQREGDKIYLIGPRTSDLNGSLFLETLEKESQSLPSLDWPMTKKLHETILDLHGKNLLASCHDVGQGGLLMALAECAVKSGLGARIAEKLPLEELLSESPSRFIVTVRFESEFRKIVDGAGIPVRLLGNAGGDSLSIAGHFELSIQRLTDIHENTLPRMMT